MRLNLFYDDPNITTEKMKELELCSYDLEVGQEVAFIDQKMLGDSWSRDFETFRFGKIEGITPKRRDVTLRVGKDETHVVKSFEALYKADVVLIHHAKNAERRNGVLRRMQKTANSWDYQSKENIEKNIRNLSDAEFNEIVKKVDDFETTLLKLCGKEKMICNE